VPPRPPPPAAQGGDTGALPAMDPALAEIVGHLAATRLFSLLEPASLAQLAPLFRRVEVTPGEVITKQDEVDGTLWVAIGGALSVDVRTEQATVEHLGYLGYGAVIGARGVFTDEPRSTSVIALEPATLLAVDREVLWRALGADRAAFDRLLLPDEARRRIEAARAGANLEGEFEVGIWRRHWIELARRMMAPLLVGLVGLGGSAALAAVAPSTTIIALLALIGLVLPVLIAGWAFLDYYQDQLIVTNRRIIHIERTPFIDAQRSETFLSRIQDVQVITPGFLATVLGYGSIRIQTAGSRQGILFTTVPDPESVRDLVFAQVQRARERASHEQRSWLERQVRQALGWEEAAEPEAPEAPPEVETPVSLRGALWEMLTYFWPKMRVQEGSTVMWRKHWWLLLRGTVLPMTGLGLVSIPLGEAILARLLGWGTGASRAPIDGAGGPLRSRIVEGMLDVGAGLPLWPFILIWLVLLLFLLYRYEDWRNDRYLLTDEHVVDIEALPFGFFEDRRQAGIAQIQDIRYRVPHIWANALGYGHVVIETAADSGNFTFDFVYHPEHVQQEIFERIERMRAREEQAAERRQAEEMARWLAAYHRVTGGESDAPN
jgi:hypothetical protein